MAPPFPLPSQFPYKKKAPKSLDEDLRRLADLSIEDYDEVPVEGYGLAILGRLGWREGMGIGRNAKKDVKSVEINKWSAGEGLGYTDVKRMICRDVEFPSDIAVNSGNIGRKITSFSDVKELGKGHSVEPDIPVIMHTSGSAGLPKNELAKNPHIPEEQESTRVPQAVHNKETTEDSANTLASTTVSHSPAEKALKEPEVSPVEYKDVSDKLPAPAAEEEDVKAQEIVSVKFLENNNPAEELKGR